MQSINQILMADPPDLHQRYDLTLYLIASADLPDR